MLFTNDCLCWINEERRKLLIPLPRCLRGAGVREDEKKVCEQGDVHGRGCSGLAGDLQRHCISAALPSSNRTPPAVPSSPGGEDPSSGSVEQGVWC